MKNKMGPSTTFKAMDAEVEDYIEELLKNGGLLRAEISAIHYYVEYEGNDDGPQVTTAVERTPHYANFLQVPMEHAKKRKISSEPIIDYTQS